MSSPTDYRRHKYLILLGTVGVDRQALTSFLGGIKWQGSEIDIGGSGSCIERHTLGHLTSIEATDHKREGGAFG